MRHATPDTGNVSLIPALGWGVSVLLGLGLAAWHLYPVLPVGQPGRVSGWFEPVYLDWRNSFITPVFTAMMYGMRWFSVQWVLGGLAVLCALFALVFCALRRKQAPHALWLVWMGAACILLAGCFWASELSYPVWRISPHVRYIQFPYRFLHILLILSPIVIILGVGCRVSGVGVPASPASLVLRPWSLVSLIVSRSRMPRRSLNPAPWRGLRRRLGRRNRRPEDGSKSESRHSTRATLLCWCGLFLLLCFPLLSALLQYRILDVATVPDWDAIPVQYYGRPFDHGQEPGWRQYVAEGYLAGEARRLRMNVKTERDHIHERVWVFEKVEGPGFQTEPHRQDACATRVRLPVFYHAGWRVEINGETAPVYEDENSALLAVALPPGRSEVRMYWGVTPEERAGYWISVVSLFLFLASLIVDRSRRRSRVPKDNGHVAVSNHDPSIRIARTGDENG